MFEAIASLCKCTTLMNPTTTITSIKLNTDIATSSSTKVKPFSPSRNFLALFTSISISNITRLIHPLGQTARIHLYHRGVAVGIRQVERQDGVPNSTGQLANPRPKARQHVSSH